MQLECKNLTYRYPGSSKTVLNDISLTISQPGFHALFGPSGVGKTSFARIISGHLNSYSGQIITSAQTVLYTYNLERLPGWSTVGAHIDKVSPQANRDLKHDLIDVFGLDEFMNMRFSKLSLGQKNRINLLRYLLQDFDVLIMDESLANVDEMTRESILLKIKSLFVRSCILYISHNVIEVAKFCDKIAVFKSTNKQPQVQMVSGCNYATNKRLEEEEINRSILEIMHAS